MKIKNVTTSAKALGTFARLCKKVKNGARIAKRKSEMVKGIRTDLV